MKKTRHAVISGSGVDFDELMSNESDWRMIERGRADTILMVQRISG
jgi:hypothetical protein